MKKFYITSVNSVSGIGKYSQDFYDLILKEKGYVLIDSSLSLTTIMSEVSSKDHAHIEIGIFQKKEIEILFTMLGANYKNVSITLHDAPLLKYPFVEFQNQFLNNISKFYDKHIDGFQKAKPLLEKIKSIYILSRKGVEVVKKRYKLNNIYYLPHVVNNMDIRMGEINNNNFVYFGFIGRNKGLEYSLQLHQYLLQQSPGINFYVIGKPIGREKTFYQSLQLKYVQNVHYLGYVPEKELNETFDKATFALLMFKNYKYFWPTSGSILYSLKKGKIVCTNNVNTIPEIISNKKTGFFLSGNLREDARIIKDLIDNKSLLKHVSAEAYNYLLENHSVAAINEKFKD